MGVWLQLLAGLSLRLTPAFESNPKRADYRRLSYRPQVIPVQRLASSERS